jgi:hypothetical protein
MKSKPNTIRVLGSDYKLAHDVHPGIGENGFYGKVEFSCRTISLRHGLDNTEKACTLLHEIIEIANADLELDLKHPQICALEKVIYSAIVDNSLVLGTLSTAALEGK